jgi:hypothetical protein
MNTQWVFEVFENGSVVAEGSAPDQESAVREAAHYVLIYGQDGGKVSALVREDTDNFEPPTVGNRVI